MIAVCLVAAIAQAAAVVTDDFGTVVFANILYRHGDRTPVQPYPTDPYRDESCWPVPFGQLTNLGKEEHLNLGRWFRNRYRHLLPDHYDPKDIYVTSTDVDRTLMSAEANLAGLYPPKGDQVWDKLQWMPIPIHTIPEKEDGILASKKYCPKYNYEMERVLASPEIKKLNEANRDLYKYLTKMTGRKVSSLQSVEEIYDNLFIESVFNKTLPEWTATVFPDRLRAIAEKSFQLEAYTTILRRLKSGTLLGQMTRHMVLKSQNALRPDRKVWIYSGHDTTIANMLMTLNLFDPPHCPPYTAVLFIELRLDANQRHVVTVSYKNTSGEPRLLTLPGCVAMCPLEQFVWLTESVIPENRERECAFDWERYGCKIDESSVVTILISSVLTLVFLVCLITGFAYWHYKRDHDQYYLRLMSEPT